MTCRSHRPHRVGSPVPSCHNGTPRYTIHQLRHTAATELREEGHKIEVVQRRLGHKDIRTTMGYAEVNNAALRAALEGGPRG